MIVRTNLSAGIGYQDLHRRLRTSPPVDFHLSGNSGLYRITTDNDVALELLKRRITNVRGYELVAINAPYDGQAEE
ncbi:MAG TPA: hypothetical protein VEL31_29680 [Ktedonobacteraceae bacterium]|nr:hypothetical protein [Ktedonobacteraceae bacterium]